MSNQTWAVPFDTYQDHTLRAANALVGEYQDQEYTGFSYGNYSFYADGNGGSYSLAEGDFPDSDDLERLRTYDSPNVNEDPTYPGWAVDMVQNGDIKTSSLSKDEAARQWGMVNKSAPPSPEWDGDPNH